MRWNVSLHLDFCARVCLALRRCRQPALCFLAAPPAFSLVYLDRIACCCRSARACALLLSSSRACQHFTFSPAFLRLHTYACCYNHHARLVAGFAAACAPLFCWFLQRLPFHAAAALRILRARRSQHARITPPLRARRCCTAGAWTPRA